MFFIINIKFNFLKKAKYYFSQIDLIDFLFYLYYIFFIFFNYFKTKKISKKNLKQNI
jgi:hypothetical protein